ncbi:hypothetical protein QJS04_geneDACA003719 [Acorus gramineus]|uniref:Uncharacterized protein n=1 Tax=Acorus gramineus TaxID=55184 RepID=A0AAV9BFF7_ACOGR|nr:hypothetical protein QJS04_geneDACA003719 [Acorus gramineus]
MTAFATGGAGLIVLSSNSSTPSVKQPTPLRLSPSNRPSQLQNPSSLAHSRRNLSLLSLLALLPLGTPPAIAFSFGIQGPKEWLKEQKRKASKYVLAPIEASRRSLRSAYLLLTTEGSGRSEESIREITSLLDSAVRDCVPQERNSFVAFQARTGVEVCTFSLILKNAASLLDDGDPLKLAAAASLDDLTSSFGSLNDALRKGSLQIDENRKVAEDELTSTISSLDKFEQNIKDCLGV